MASLKDIALKTGLSINTVSRAIRKQGYVSPRAMQDVIKAAAELGYSPNKAARSLRFRKNFGIAVIIDNSISEPMHMEKIVGMRNRIESSDYELKLNFANYSSDSMDYYSDFINSILRENPAAVIIMGEGQKALFMADICKSKNVPIVLMSYSDKKDYDCVYIDRAGGVFDAVNYLFSKGHRKIAFAGPLNCVNRMRGYREALALNGLQEFLIPVEYAKFDFIYKACFDKITEVLKDGLKVDAIHCYSDYMAAGIMGGLQKGGVLIPDDVAVTGFDGRDFSKFLTPNLTTVSQENRRAGELAVETVINKIEGKSGTGHIAVKVPMSLKIRDSA